MLLALSDARKFAKIKLFDSKDVKTCNDLKNLGPDALEVNFLEFKECLFLRPMGKIKQVLINQEIIAGIGNIYSDEILWKVGIHPESRISKIPKQKFSVLHKAMREILKKGIDCGGDSTSDYRDIRGLRGKFQHHHNVYRRKGASCLKHDGGIITRIIVGGRSGHFCPTHQKFYS